jgi:hypothetical protein
MCRVASSTHRRAIGGPSQASRVLEQSRMRAGQRTKASLAGVVTYDSRRAWRVGLGSSSTCDPGIRRKAGPGYVNLHSNAYVARSATGVSEVASNRRTSTRRKRSIETGRHHRSAQRRREAPSAPVLLERTRKPSGSGCPFDSRDGQKSVVRIFGSSIRGVARHHGPPAGLATEALT